MLILTRHVGESLMIGNQISITVCRIKGGQVQIGIAAPRSMAVRREEIYQRTQGAGLDVRLSARRSHRRDVAPG